MAWIRIEQSLTPRTTQNSTGWLSGLISVLFLALLAMMVTVSIVGSYHVAVDDAVALGIAGSLVVLLLVVALVGYFVVLGFRQGQGSLAAKRSMAALLVGLPAAAVVGVLPWLGHRLIVAMPWVAHFPWGIAILLLLLLRIHHPEKPQGA